MEKLMDFIKNHRIAAIGAAVLILLLILAAIILLSLSDDSNDEQDDRLCFFADTGKPVYVSRDENKLILEISGYDSSDLSWGISPELNKLYHSDYNTDDNGNLTVTLSPMSQGYLTIDISQAGKIGEMDYKAVSVTVDIMINNGESGVLNCLLGDIHQQLSAAGALDTDTPYLIKDNKVFLPCGGDWELTAEYPQDTENKPYEVYTGSSDDNDIFFYGVNVNNTMLSSYFESNGAESSNENGRLILKSQQLEKEILLDCTVGADGDWKLLEVKQ